MIKQGHVLDVLKAMPDDSVQCVITSPPYYGLRSYGTEPQVWGNHNGCSHEWGCELSKKQLRGSLTNINNSKEVFNKALADIHLSTGNFCLSCNAWRGELGLEPTFQLYISHLIEIFAEVKRVLKPSGTCFVNLGDSYAGSGRGPTGTNGIGNQTKRQGFSSAADVQRATAYGISDKAPEDSPNRDCACRNLCDVCQQAYRTGISHNGDSRAAKPILLLSETIPACKASERGRLPTSDSVRQVDRIASATPDFESLPVLESEQLPASPASTPGQSSEQLLDAYLRKASVALCLSCGVLLADDVPPSECTTACLSFAQQSESLERGLSYNTDDSAGTGGSSANRTQDRVYASSAYLDYSTKSRPQVRPKSLMNIPARFAIAMTDELQMIQRNEIIWHKPACMPSSATDRFTVDFEPIYFFAKNPKYKFNQQLEESASDWTKKGGSIINATGYQDGAYGKRVSTGVVADGETRNKRTTWRIPFEPQKEKHYASYPTKLVEPMILAGTDEGDTVLDPFNGTGTTGIVALRNRREYIGIELQPEYVEIANRRLATVDAKLFT